ncbi:BadF/BadG/BcrA/BcrD ATPase family protein [Dictyobacter halimunensis]
MMTNDDTSPQATSPASYYLGIDGGGSKTLAVLVNQRGEEVGRGLAGSANYTGVGLATAVSNIYTATQQALSSLDPQTTISKAWLGVAGVDRPADHAALMPQLQDLAQTVYLTNDAELGLSVLPEAVGVVVIAGTGSIALGRNSSSLTSRAGGWGHLLGDEGSGYALGIQALQAAVRAADGRAPQTILLERILQTWELTNAEELISAVYFSDDKSKIARLSTCVLQAERDGDATAAALVQTAIAELVLVVKTVAAKLNFTAQRALPLALGGGLLLNETSFQARFLKQLASVQPLDPVVHIEQPALNAARTIIHLTGFQHWTRV